MSPISFKDGNAAIQQEESWDRRWGEAGAGVGGFFFSYLNGAGDGGGYLYPIFASSPTTNIKLKK